MGYSENTQLIGICREDGKLSLDSLITLKERNAATRSLFNVDTQQWVKMQWIEVLCELGALAVCWDDLNSPGAFFFTYPMFPSSQTCKAVLPLHCELLSVEQEPAAVHSDQAGNKRLPFANKNSVEVKRKWEMTNNGNVLSQTRAWEYI